MAQAQLVHGLFGPMQIGPRSMHPAKAPKGALASVRVLGVCVAVSVLNWAIGMAWPNSAPSGWPNWFMGVLNNLVLLKERTS